MNRLEVLAVRLVPTVVVLGIVLGLVYALWYPGGYASLADVHGRVLILVAAGLIIGPGLTAVVFRPDKRCFAFDLAVLVALEVAFVGTMTWSLYERRPAFTVFAVDRFEVVLAGEVDVSSAADPMLRSRPGHEPRLAFAEMPSDPEEFDRLFEETVMQGLPDIDRRPRHWKPYPNGIQAVRENASPLGKLASSPDRGEVVLDWLKGRESRGSDYLYLPIHGWAGIATLVIRADIGYPVAILPVDPW